MEPQISLNLQNETLDSVEQYKFEPIKGYPMLNWKGKRPFTSTQYYPAQLKENHGEEVNGWMNKIFWGDNVQVMSHLLKEFRGKIDLVYIDPPFDSKADYKKRISLKGKSVTNNQSSFEEKQYSDLWSNDEYLQFMYERILLLKELLSSTGTIYLHCDYRRSHFLKLILDEIFGSNNFLNEIVWVRTNSHNMKSKGFVRSNDYILIYTKNPIFTFKEQFLPYGESQLNEYREDENGRLYTTRDLTFSSSNSNRQFEWRGTQPPPNRSWGSSFEQLEKLFSEGRIVLNREGNPRLRGLKVYLDETNGTPLTTNWDDIGRVGNTSKERLDYPTQKPESLLERILKTSSNKGDIVFDCFMGSGTTQAVAIKLGRRFIGADINLGSIQTTTKRLLNVISDLKTEQKKLNFDDDNEELTYYTGFSVYNVNNYDVFRNPVQAKDLLKQALEIQPMPNNSLYDGEKDGRMVKIMPINRIATRADLNELLAGFNYKEFEKKSEANPGKAVEHILIVCMGHEPDLKAHVVNGVAPFKIDIEVVDILRDKSNLEFKRDSEAKVLIENGKLIIKEFYPMNLLQKLSIMKDNVEDWKELTESVMIDFNFDGSIFEPKLVDVPSKDEMVKGVYHIPDGAGTIRVKITDLLSESIELEVSNG